MLKMYCDRCKKEMAILDLDALSFNSDNAGYAITDLDDNRPIHLCNDCTKAFHVWLYYSIASREEKKDEE